MTLPSSVCQDYLYYHLLSSMIASSVNCQPWIIGYPFNFMNDGNLGATVCRKWKPWWTKCKLPDLSTKALSKTKDAVPRSQSKSQQLVIAPPPRLNVPCTILPLMQLESHLLQWSYKIQETRTVIIKSTSYARAVLAIAAESDFLMNDILWR